MACVEMERLVVGIGERGLAHTCHMIGSASAARKALWNPACVELVHWKLAHIDPGSRVSGTNQIKKLVRSQWNKSNKKTGNGVETPHQETSCVV